MLDIVLSSIRQFIASLDTVPEEADTVRFSFQMRKLRNRVTASLYGSTLEGASSVDVPKP